MRLFVIMANDFPEGIMDNEAQAEALVKTRNAADKAAHAIDQPKWGQARVYWKVYPFELNKVAE